MMTSEKVSEDFFLFVFCRSTHIHLKSKLRLSTRHRIHLSAVHTGTIKMEHEDPLQINLRSPQAAVLQASVQAKLGQLGYAAAEDAVMAEYVIVMLANRKGPHQVSDEMRDLIGEDYDPQFVEWLWGEGRAILSGGQPSTNQSGPSRGEQRAARNSERST